MSEDKKNGQNDQQTEEQKTSDETQQKLRKISDEDFNRILENHRKWVESDGKEGEKADLRNLDLQGANLSYANLEKANMPIADLQEAILLEANLQKATLVRTNLQKATLVRTNLQKALLLSANLQKANLFEANLQKADLSKANLQEASLSGANLQEGSLEKANLQKALLLSANLQKADLLEANLQEVSLLEANLQKASLKRANLQNGILSQANLKEAILNKADMQNTVLDGVKGLAEANLQYANFQGATGLLGNEFAQADVTGVKLPDDIKEFKALETVKETSQNARKIFFAMLLGCVYSWLTIATTTDVRLLTNTASSPLPIIGTEIPIAWFYLTAPLVLICLYFYFHLYLDNLWKGLASLPAIFPDGKPLDQTAYPWLLNSLVNRHFRILKKRAEIKAFEELKVKIDKVFKKFKIKKDIKIRPIIFYLKEWITIFLAWWVVPITMIAFWLRYIPRHDWWGTNFHIGLIVVSVAFAIIFYRLCVVTLQGKEKIGFQFKSFWKNRRSYYGVSVFVVGIVLSIVSYKAINSQSFSADFREKSVSEKPSNYWEIDKEERMESVNGANLKGRNLKYADMYKAFLVKADLRDANLQNANLMMANLQKASLSNAILSAILDEANLQNADLLQTVLRNASLVRAKLQNADLYGAFLQYADLRGADLQNAIFHRAHLQSADLMNANFLNANFVAANLQKADLKDTNLKEADFTYANLAGVKNLTIKQLCKAKTLYKAQLDPELIEQVKKCCPHLLEEPKEKAEREDETE
jgi:uncharacterized protein YjbI with pentapeptide repeats